METVKTIEYRGYEIEVYQDLDAENPREWENLGTMVCCSRRYDLGDKQAESGAEAVFKTLNDLNYKNADKLDDEWVDLGERGFFEEYYQKLYDYALLLPLYLYDHSILRISTNSFIGRAQHAEWDSGQVGFIYVSKEQVKKEWEWEKISKKREQKLYGILESEVKTYDQYLAGDVYRYSVLGEEGEEIDSCGIFYGYDEEESGLLEYAKDSIDYHIKQLEQKESNARKLAFGFSLAD